ncbi:MAG TPA: hypothetical protein VFR81_01110 [Longimicrobium sp.]|nr:hypothetical protein [Longimicrobium sp.]
MSTTLLSGGLAGEVVRRADALADRDLRPDRLHYATGVLLDREDFQAEQLYHRGRLARAMALLAGSGTVAGLRVTVEPVEGEDEELVRIAPGAAIDRLGRVIELPRSACLRLGRWMAHLAGEREDDLAAARFLGAADDPVATQAPGPDDQPPLEGAGDKAEWKAWTNGYVLADVFLAFAPCERGKTPAFATGPFDALDAAQPSRVRDGYELALVPRAHAPVPDDPWAALSAAGVEGRTRAAQRTLLERGWRDAVPEWDERRGVRPAVEHPPEVDPSGVLLARLFIPVGAAGKSRDLAHRVLVNNHLRRFAYPGPALAWLARQ